MYKCKFWSPTYRENYQRQAWLRFHCSECTQKRSEIRDLSLTWRSLLCSPLCSSQSSYPLFLDLFWLLDLLTPQQAFFHLFLALSLPLCWIVLTWLSARVTGPHVSQCQLRYHLYKWLPTPRIQKGALSPSFQFKHVHRSFINLIFVPL